MRDLLIDLARAMLAGFQHGHALTAQPPATRPDPGPRAEILTADPELALQAAMLVLERHAWSEPTEQCECGYRANAAGDPSWFEHCALELAQAGLLGPIAQVHRPLTGHAHSEAVYRLVRSLHFLDADPGDEGLDDLAIELELDHRERLEEWANADAEHLADAMAKQGLALIRTAPRRVTR
jgi:hypothetical protein